ncbi:MAG: DUF1573 domain-containing protein [Firmicutes bacterium]|nr:DUF1573 domain-containing protein [Bacillota bacterium]
MTDMQYNKMTTMNVMKLQLLLYLAITVLSVSSCRDNKKRKVVEDIVNEWFGKEILFPEGIQCYMGRKDTLPEICSENFQKEFKILMYVDSAGCSDCRLRLSDWKQLIEEADSLFPEQVGVLLYFQPKSAKEMTYLLAQSRFDYPVFMDLNGTINRLNLFPQAMEHQCFLLDKDNKVLMIGNPALNHRIWELYKEQITGGKKTGPEILTTVILDKTAHNYGTIRKGSSNPAVFRITNTGSHPLVISRVSTSCGCTNVDWEKRPIAPGQTATVNVDMVPDETGYFSKTIDVYCNIKESTIRLMVNGNASE